MRAARKLLGSSMSGCVAVDEIQSFGPTHSLCYNFLKVIFCSTHNLTIGDCEAANEIRVVGKEQLMTLFWPYISFHFIKLGD